MKLPYYIFLFLVLSSCSQLPSNIEYNRSLRDYRNTDDSGNILVKHNCESVKSRILRNELRSLNDSMHTNLIHQILFKYNEDFPEEAIEDFKTQNSSHFSSLSSTDFVLYEFNQKTYYFLILTDTSIKVIYEANRKHRLWKWDREFIDLRGTPDLHLRYLKYYDQIKSKDVYFRIAKNAKFTFLPREGDWLFTSSYDYIGWRRKDKIRRRINRIVKNECEI